MTVHSILPPSRAARRMACPGSRALEGVYKREESESAREGTRAHEIAAQLLIRKYAVEGFQAASPSRLPTDTDQMFEGAKLLAESIEFHIEVHLLSKIVVEERIDIKSIHPECFGTPDVWALSKDNVLHIWDYKYGHSYVNAYQNWQMIEYSAGIIDFIRRQASLNAPFPKAVHFHIVQPRCYAYTGENNWYVSYDNLLPLFDKLRASENLSMRPDAKCQPSPQCRNCDASHVCKALQLAALETTETATRNTPNGLTPDAIGNELRILQHAQTLLDARINGLEQNATTLMKQGKQIPHFTLEETRSREVWKVPAEKVKALGSIYDKDLTKPISSVITPSQAEKLGIPRAIIDKYVERPHGGLKLKPDDGSKARKVFGKNA